MCVIKAMIHDRAFLFILKETLITNLPSQLCVMSGIGSGSIPKPAVRAVFLSPCLCSTGEAAGYFLSAGSVIIGY